MPKRIDTPLTSQQRQWAADSHDLIYGYLTLKNLDEREWYDDLAIMLCYAARNYDPTRGQPSTLIYKYFDCAVKRRIGREAKKSKAFPVRFLQDLVFDADENTLTVEEVVGFDDPNIERTEWEALEDQVLSQLSASHRIVWDMYKQGALQRDIGNALGISHQAVSNKVRDVRKQATKLLSIGGI